jgi:hypothetical protein
MFKFLLEKVNDSEDALIYILLYCIVFRSGSVLLNNLKDLLYAPFSAYCEYKIGI